MADSFAPPPVPTVRVGVSPQVPRMASHPVFPRGALVKLFIEATGRADDIYTVVDGRPSPCEPQSWEFSLRLDGHFVRCLCCGESSFIAERFLRRVAS